MVDELDDVSDKVFTGICSEMTKIMPIILSGGAGTRLWPISRRMHPKPFMEVAGKPLLAHALARALHCR